MAQPEQFRLAPDGIVFVVLLISSIIINPRTGPFFHRPNTSHKSVETKDPIQKISDSAKHIVLGDYCQTTLDEKSVLPSTDYFIPATIAIQLLYLKQWGVHHGLDPADVDREIRESVQSALTTPKFRKSPLAQWTNLSVNSGFEHIFQTLYVEPIEAIVSSELFDQKPEIAAAVIFEEDKMQNSEKPPTAEELNNWSVRVYNYWLPQLGSKEGLTSSKV